MNRLSKKFIAGISIILLLACGCMILFNTVFLERYYLYQKRNTLSAVCDSFSKAISQGKEIEEVIAKTENENKVIVVRIGQFQEKDSDSINDEIRSAYQGNGIGFQKYWLWKEDEQRIRNGEVCTRLYEQESLNYSLLVEYQQIDSSLYVITMIVPNITDAFGIINSFLIGVNIVSIIIAILIIILLIKKIVRPLTEFQSFAARMENNQFIPVDIHTNDELEDVADSLNNMGNRIVQYQTSLKEKNQQMEQLMDNVAHDLKTPISLIHLYATGIKDGLDDGTFLNTIIKENEQMAEMVNRLLYLSRMDKKAYEKTEINLSEYLGHLVDKYSVMAEKNNLEICPVFEKNILIIASEELVTSLFTNLITNAIKYASGKEILIKLLKEKNQIVFSISNETDNSDLDVSKIWEPYYVGEKSRNKTLSGTGLGLSIVRKICETQNYKIQCSLQNRTVTFTIMIPF